MFVASCYNDCPYIDHILVRNLIKDNRTLPITRFKAKSTAYTGIVINLDYERDSLRIRTIDCFACPKWSIILKCVICDLNRAGFFTLATPIALCLIYEPWFLVNLKFEVSYISTHFFKFREGN